MNKLHIGCGERYLEGYVNIDLPPEDHTVQEKHVADLFADLRTLNYPACSVDEIRSHHLFEHFTRPVACALLAGWFSWVKPGGLIHIEVPDFQKTALAVLLPFVSRNKKSVALRHLYGSHEAVWAIHCEGYTGRSLSSMLGTCGFEVFKLKSNSCKGTYNIEMFATSVDRFFLKEDFETRCCQYFTRFLLDTSKGEMKLLETWMRCFKEQLDLTWSL